ncbi:hypothetical protein YC2023_101524 [Brassica napus]
MCSHKSPIQDPYGPSTSPSGSMISRSLYIPLSLLPQIVKSIPLSWRKTLQFLPAKLLLLFRHVSPGPGDSTLQFRLLHFWEARKNVKGGPDILLGIEMLMIDSEGTLAQGFIGQNLRNQYEKQLRRGSIYTLTSFYASNSKVMYHVADQRLVICISHASHLSKVEENTEGILTERFRIHSFLDFEANCDLRGDLHAGLTASLSISVRFCAPMMTQLLGKLCGPVINVYLWNEAAENFRLKFDACAATPTVLLVTTVNPKRLGGKLCLTSMSSSRVFLDEEVDPTKEYLNWLNTNPSATSTVNPVEVVKSETLTISEIAAFIKRQPAKENGGDGAELEVPLPQCFIDAIGQTKKFRIKVAPYNFTSTRLSLTATKIVSSAVLPPKNPPLNTPPGTEVKISELAESSGGGTSATDDQKNA